MKVIIYDIETFKEIFLIRIFDPELNKSFEFIVNKWRNDLDAFMLFIEKYKEYYWVGYNNLRFDSQVVEWVIRNYENWHELSSIEICGRICRKAQDIIDDANYDIFPNYREFELTLKQIDLFKVAHYDNKNRRVSLKRLEFEMDLENIEEIPIHFLKENLTANEIKLIRDYCKNDVHATYEFYKIIIGNTNHPLYKGNNQIQLRLDIQAEFGIDCLNFSDSKIGDEIIKKYYCEEKGIGIKQLPKKGFFRKEVLIKNCIASYVSFKTPQLKQFLKKIKDLSIGQKDDFKESIEFYGNTYSFMKGGIHSENRPEIFEANGDIIILDYDVSSMYPATIINNGRYPYHLGKEFLVGYKKMYDKRLELKPLAKKDKKIAGIVGALKLAVNSVYGKSSDMSSWIYDRQLTMFTTITGELAILMLIEAYELAGIHVISANTDGVTIQIHKDLYPKVEEINKWWQETTKYELEKAEYEKIIFSTVNDYIALKKGYNDAPQEKKEDFIKKKGDFLTDFELHKNKSARICPIALENFYIKGIPIEKTIREHQNIYDFVKRQKSSKDFHYEGITGKNTVVYNKLIRYYVSLQGEKLFKIKNPECKTNAADVSQVEAGDWLCRVCNHIPQNSKITDFDINYSYYIEKCQELIDKITLNGRKRVKQQPKNQLTMF